MMSVLMSLKRVLTVVIKSLTCLTTGGSSANFPTALYKRCPTRRRFNTVLGSCLTAAIKFLMMSPKSVFLKVDIRLLNDFMVPLSRFTTLSTTLSYSALNFWTSS